MTEREVSSERLPERCPHCDLNWSYHPPTIVAATDKVRCIECKIVFVPPVSSERVSEELHLTTYELQVLLGTTIHGRNMAPDQVFSLPMAWHRLHALGLIDRTDGLAIATDKAIALVQELLALRSSVKTEDADEDVFAALAEEELLSAIEAPAAASEVADEMRKEALRLLQERDERDDRVQELIEDLRELVLTMPAADRPEGLMKKAQAATYAMRGRTRLMDDAAITAALKGDRP